MMKEAQDNAADMDIAEAAEYLRKETKKVEKRKSKRKLQEKKLQNELKAENKKPHKKAAKDPKSGKTPVASLSQQKNATNAGNSSANATLVQK